MNDRPAACRPSTLHDPGTVLAMPSVTNLLNVTREHGDILVLRAPIDVDTAAQVAAERAAAFGFTEMVEHYLDVVGGVEVMVFTQA